MAASDVSDWQLYILWVEPTPLSMLRTTPVLLTSYWLFGRLQKIRFLLPQDLNLLVKKGLCWGAFSTINKTWRNVRLNLSFLQTIDIIHNAYSKCVHIACKRMYLSYPKSRERTGEILIMKSNIMCNDSVTIHIMYYTQCILVNWAHDVGQADRSPCAPDIWRMLC